MKITNLISMLAAATAVGFCMSAKAGEGQSGKLELADPVTNVNVTTTVKVGGDWNTAPAVSTDGNYFEIETDDASTNVFTATGNGITTGKVVTCTFVLKPSPVSCTGTPPAPDGEAQVAFCIATNTASGGSTLQAYLGSGWVELAGVVPTSEYTLAITLDYSGSPKYAKFAIDGTPLTNNTETWLEIGTSKTGVSEYCFVGSGSLKSILTTGQDIKAEEINITPQGGSQVEIAVPEELVAALRDAGTVDIAEALVENAGNGKSLLENYVIFGVTNASEVTSATKPEAKIATAKVGDDIPLAFQNLNVKTVSGMTVKYQLKGQKSSAAEWETLGSETTSQADLKITPAHISEGYRNFKVVVAVQYN